MPTFRIALLFLTPELRARDTATVVPNALAVWLFVSSFEDDGQGLTASWEFCPRRRFSSDPLVAPLFPRSLHAASRLTCCDDSVSLRTVSLGRSASGTACVFPRGTRTLLRLHTMTRLTTSRRLCFVVARHSTGKEESWRKTRDGGRERLCSQRT